MRRSNGIRQFCAFGGLLLVVLWACSHIRCAYLAERAGPAVDVAEYKASLDECRKEGKRRKSYAVYAQCADEVDLRYGLDGGAK